MKDFILRNRRVLALKAAVAVALAVSHYYPGDYALLTNLVWLFLF